MLYLFRIDTWHQNGGLRSRDSKRYDAFNGFVVRIDHHLYHKEFYFVLDYSNTWQ